MNPTPTYRYTIPLIPRSLNEYAGRRNTWEYRNDKSEWLRIIWACCREKPTKPLEKSIVTIEYHFPDNRRRDPDNYCGKMILDGLVSCGIIKDDSFGHVELRLRGCVDKANPRTEVTVEQSGQNENETGGEPQ